MIHVIITSYGEINATKRSIEAVLSQKTDRDFKISVIDPFLETEHVLKESYGDKVNFFLDPGEGKSYALNVFLERIFSNNPGDIIVLTDGDVYISENAIEEISSAFLDKGIGCVTGRPVSLNPKRDRFGYWSHLLFEGIHLVRKQLSENKRFFECSGYLFAIRNGVLKGFPLEASEDSIIPYLFWKKGYKIKYCPKAEVYVLNPRNWRDYKLQKIRNIKGHENLTKIAKNMPRTKSFKNELKRGLLFSLKYPDYPLEYIWTIELIFTRFYIYLLAFYDIKFRKKKYSDGWRKDEIKSTKPLD